MAELHAIARHALSDVATPGRHGVPDGSAGVAASLVWPLSIALVTARFGEGDRCRASLASLTDRDAAQLAPRRMVSGNGLDVAWTGPDRWLVVTSTSAMLEDKLGAACDGTATIVDQSDGRFLLRLRGGKVLACLAKGIGIDLHPRVFRPGDTAPVWLSHLQVQLSRRHDGEIYDLVGPRAAAGDLWHWLVASAGEFGLSFDAPT